MVEGKRTSQPLLVQEEGLEQAGPAWECTGQEVTGRHSWKAEEGQKPGLFLFAGAWDLRLRYKMPQ